MFRITTKHHVFFLLFFITPLLCFGQTIFYPDGFDCTFKTQPENCQIAWDIHGVLAELKSGTWKTVVEYSPHLIGHGLGSLFSSMTGKKGPLRKALRERKKLPKDFDVSGEASYNIFKKYNLKTLMRFTERLANAYKPMRGIESVVNTLHNQGFTQRIASNIGPRFYTIMKQKFARRRSSIFSLVPLGKVVDYSRFGDHSTKPCLEPEFLVQKGKPHPDFYQEFSACFNPDNQIIILIDDKIENCKAAARAGWIGVHFRGKRKQALAQLQKDLKILGLL